MDQPQAQTFLVDNTEIRDLREANPSSLLFPEPVEQDEAEENTLSQTINLPPLPYGLQDLEDTISTDQGPPFRVRCYVRGCQEMLQPPRRGFRGEACPVHGIFCHLSGSNATFAFRNPCRNLITSQSLFARKVRGNKHKVESHRFGFLNSEDAVTWNVFRSLQEADALHLVAQWITGRELSGSPLLYLWGLSSFDDRFEPWPLLTTARQRFEIDKLPITRPLSEPDIAVLYPGQVLILIEAKVLAPNPIVYRDQPRKSSQSLTMEELLELYRDPSLSILDLDRIHSCERTWPQLYRYFVFGEFMAHLDGPHTEAFLANLVRAGCEHDSTSEFSQYLRPEYADRFIRVTWETIYALSGLHWRKLTRLQEYMLSKPVGVCGGFTPAFQLDAW